MAQTNPRYQWSIKENWRNLADTSEGIASETYNLIDQTTKAVVWSKTYPPNILISGKDYTNFLIGSDDLNTALSTAPDVLLGQATAAQLRADIFDPMYASAGYVIGSASINLLTIAAAAAVLWFYFKRR